MYLVGILLFLLYTCKILLHKKEFEMTGAGFLDIVSGKVAASTQIINARQLKHKAAAFMARTRCIRKAQQTNFYRDQQDVDGFFDSRVHLLTRR